MSANLAGHCRSNRVLSGWLALGCLAFGLLPWYLPQNLTLLGSMGGILGGDDTASGLVQAAMQRRPWLWFAALGLGLCAAATRAAGTRAQGLVLLWGAGVGLAGLLLSGFTIGARGWVFEPLALRLGEFGQQRS